jgi:predicted permease
VSVQPLADLVSAPVRRSLWMLFAAVGLVLAAACANVANLLLARTSVRVREVVTRAALGAGRTRLAQQFLVESLCLGLAGGAGGIAVAWWGTRVLARVGAARLPRAHEVGFDAQAFGFLLVVCVGAAMIVGLAPAVFASRLDAHGVARDGGGHATMGRGVARLRDGLVVVDVTLAFVLACAALVVVREVVRLKRVDTGMAISSTAVLSLTPRVTAADYQAIEDRVARLPNVRAAGFIQMVPLQNWGWEADFNIRGRTPDPGVRRTTELRFVTPGYFDAMGIALLRGRGFTAADIGGTPPVVVINDTLAKRYFAGDDPIGRVLDRGTIVGVIADVKNVRLDAPAVPELYYAAAQNLAMTSTLGMSLAVRTDGAPESVIPSVRAAIADLRPGLAVFNVRTMEQVVDDSLADLHLYRGLIGLFATLALLLAAVGLFGVIAYMTTLRTREFAIRMALGSGAPALGAMVLRRSLGLGLTGVATGTAATALLSGVLRQSPNGGAPGVTSYVAVGGIVIATAVLAAASPALRAATVNPATALRND